MRGGNIINITKTDIYRMNKKELSEALLDMLDTGTSEAPGNFSLIDNLEQAKQEAERYAQNNSLPYIINKSWQNVADSLRILINRL